MAPLLELKNVTKIFGGGVFDKYTTVAVDNLSMNIHAYPPRITAIAGESGSGKTTLANLMMGLIEPTDGKVFYLGRDVEEMNKHDRLDMKREVQPVFQDPFGVYNPFYRVDHVLTTPVLNFNLADNKKEAMPMVVEALETVGLRAEETLGRFPHQLSGGQRQRVMVARALLLKPKVILADEPVSMVDASLRATILESIRTLNQELGIAVMYITHDLTTAYQISEDIVVMYEGTMAEVGDVRQVIKEPKHPYTQLLVDSIPQADINRKWGEGTALKEAEGGASSGQGCRFAARCPNVMPMCRESAPPLYRIGERRAASCFLYRESGETTADDVMMSGE
jgi:peptide/nickel transport system ATP-binding protein